MGLPNIAVLDPQVVAKIAAGEVIERPSAVVRELLDNSIDAGATQISLHLEEGGVQMVRVSDNGIGMSREDLELCYLPYATSKIRETDDLLKLCSLGFRGEALSSIAACSKLRIRSAQEGDNMACELRVDDSIFQGIKSVPTVEPGTQIEVRDLFYTFPARRKFLKSTRSELHSCKSIFYEKALSFPHIYFQLYNSGKMEHSLTPGSAIERICQIYGDLVPEQLFPLKEETQHFSFTLFAAPPQLYRRDRKRMPIYVNQRCISETSLQQAIRIGYDGYLAGGLFPLCLCFLELAPDRVDFNIHPAKREARMRDLNLIQGAIRQTLRSFCSETGSLAGNPSLQEKEAPDLKTTNTYSKAPAHGAPRHSAPSYSFSPRDISGDSSEKSSSTSEIPHSSSALSNPTTTLDISNVEFHCGFHYYGQLFEVFLLVERTMDGVPQFLIVDQHASHERILYETLQREMLQKQPLLVPIELELDSSQEAALPQRIEALAAIGIQIEKKAPKEWLITTLPPSVNNLKEELIELVIHGSSEAEDLKRELFAHLSCRKAIKKGDILDDVTAGKLLETLFAMKLERCPHGRPLWYSLNRKELYRLLQRT